MSIKSTWSNIANCGAVTARFIHDIPFTWSFATSRVPTPYGVVIWISAVWLAAAHPAKSPPMLLKRNESESTFQTREIVPAVPSARLPDASAPMVSPLCRLYHLAVAPTVRVNSASAAGGPVGGPHARGAHPGSCAALGCRQALWNLQHHWSRLRRNRVQIPKPKHDLILVARRGVRRVRAGE